MEKKRETNFKKAMDELLGVPNNREKETEGAVKKPEVIPKPEEKPALKKEEAIISSEMKIEGNITASCNMQIFGSVKGNISSTANICLRGIVEGNVHALNLIVESGSVAGDVSVQENLKLAADTFVQGNVDGKNLYCNGKIEGKIQAKDEVELKAKAEIFGDICAKNFSVSSGAKIKGSVEIHE